VIFGVSDYYSTYWNNNNNDKKLNKNSMCHRNPLLFSGHHALFEAPGTVDGRKVCFN
jgi:hypothetical protein